MKQFLRFLTSFVIAYVEKYDKFHFNLILCDSFVTLFQNYVDFALVVRGKVMVSSQFVNSGNAVKGGDGAWRLMLL